MKKLFGILIILSLVALFPVKLAAQGFTVDAVEKQLDGAKIISFAGTIDTTESYISKEFYISDCDSVYFSAMLSGTSASTRKVSCQIRGSNFVRGTGTYAAIDSLMISDSVATEVSAKVDLGSVRYRRYTLQFTGTTGNDDTDYNVAVYAIKRK